MEQGQHELQQTTQRLREGQEQLQQTTHRLQEGQVASRHESREFRTYLRDILRRMSIFNDTLLTIQADYRDIYDRVRGLELKNEINGEL